MDKELRNTLRNTVTKCRKLLEEAIGELLQGRFGIHADGTIEDSSRLTHLSPNELRYREEVLAHLEHIKASGLKPNDATAQLIREAAFTHLNRLCAYKMMAERGLMQDPVGRGLKSRGFLFYLADHPEDETLYNSSQQDLAFRHYLEWINDSFALEIGVLFAREDVATPLFPPHRVIEEVLELINSPKLQLVWAQDETIGWIFQYFTPKEMRDKARKESAAPRNSYEMSFRNQFFTPRYVVEFLVDNTLGRTWHEMRDGGTLLAEKCQYLALNTSADAQEANGERISNLRQRAKKDPRDITVLDPACGSGHFLLYCFDLFLTIYEEAYSDPNLGAKLQQEFPDADEFKRQIPRLILAHNLHGIDIDLRVTQLAALALWLRAQRAFQDMGLTENRPPIRRMNLVCAEPMPGEDDLLEEFIAELSPHPLGGLIGELVRNVFARMKLAGEAGALVRIEDDISEPIEEARRTWQEMLQREAKRAEELATKGVLFDYQKEEAQQKLVFDIADITSEKVWRDAEEEVVRSLRDYARRAGNGKGLLRRLFAEDAEQGFAFIDLCRQKFDVVLMNPPFGDASLPSKPYIDETYGDTKGDVYKAFVECFQDRLVAGGFLGIISSRTGFFLSGSSDWRERIVLRLYRPLVLADFGMGVLDAMVETAAYVLRSLTEEEDRQLTLQLAKDLEEVPTDRNDVFSTKKYETTRDLKRHQATGELRKLYEAGFIKPVEGHFPRWSPLRGEITKAPAPSNVPYPLLVCLRLLGEVNKGDALYEVLVDVHDPRHFVAAPEDFRQVPNTPFSYWVSSGIRRLFSQLLPLESNGRVTKQGLSTADDFRFVRLWWEVRQCTLCPPSSHPLDSRGAYCVLGNYRWFPFAKGGTYSPYYSDIPTVCDWREDGRELKEWAGSLYGGSHWSRIIKNTEFYFRPGITWPLRGIHLSTQAVPAGGIFSVAGKLATSYNCDDLPILLAVTNTKAFDYFVGVFAGKVGGVQYEVGLIGSIPFPVVEKSNELESHLNQAYRVAAQQNSFDERGHLFHVPALLQVRGDTLEERITDWQSRLIEAEQQLAEHQREIDDIAFCLYGISDEDRRAIEASLTRQPSPDADGEQAETDDEAEDESASTDGRQLTADLISYAVGCAFGRWDLRFATGDRSAPELPDPFAPLPIGAPGALTGEDGLSLREAPENYPLRVDWDGILVDDPSHGNDDLTARVREVFELVWSTAADAREREACELLGVKELRDYFRKSAAGGFWTHHVKRYSRSRRKAPIYWYLRSLKGNYGLWLYYHRLDKDILYKALLNYVEPKLHLEENNLAQLKQRREAVGTTGREGKQLEKDLDKQESFLSELYDFRDKLKRAADLNLEPDLNDGVVLNIAPLWELVPWKEAEKYSKELIAGKYEWSSIAKQLRERGLVKK